MTARSKNPVRRRGFTLTELLVVISIIVLVLGISLPAIMQLLTAGVSERGEAVFSALLGTARGLAVQRQAYVLVHFQMGRRWLQGVCRPDGKCYGVIMVHEPWTDPSTGQLDVHAITHEPTRKFIPLKGYAPRALPSGFALGEVSDAFSDSDHFNPILNEPDANAEKGEPDWNFTTFNIIFAPDGSICQQVPQVDASGNVVPGAPQIDTTSWLFSDTDDEDSIWQTQGVEISEDGVRIVVAFEYKALRNLNEGPYTQADPRSRAHYLQNEGKILCINPYTGKLLPSE